MSSPFMTEIQRSEVSKEHNLCLLCDFMNDNEEKN